MTISNIFLVSAAMLASAALADTLRGIAGRIE